VDENKKDEFKKIYVDEAASIVSSSDNLVFEKEESKLTEHTDSHGSSSRTSSLDHRSSSSSHSGSSSHRSSGSGRSSSSNHSSSSSGRSGSSSHRSSSSGRSGSSSHRSSGPSRSGSSSHRSSGSGRSGSSRHRSSSSGSKGGKGHKYPLAGRLRDLRHTLKSKYYKYTPKYLYKKYKYRFKKASKQKKAGYILLLLSFFILLGIGVKYAVTGDVIKDTVSAFDKDKETTKAPAKKKTPQVGTLFELNETVSSAGFTSGFSVKLPELLADSEAAKKMNASMAELRDDLKEKYKQAGNLSTYPNLYDVSYHAFNSKEYVFISIYDYFESKSGEKKVVNTYYLYDYINEVMVEDYSLPELYKLDEVKTLEIVNAKLEALGAPFANSTEGFGYFVDKSGKLCATLTITNASGVEKEITVTLD